MIKKSGFSDKEVIEESDKISKYVKFDNKTNVMDIGCGNFDLLNLILPNVLLALNPGSRITFYPYVYVELINVGTGANRNIIYSNNPNSTKMLFRCPINDVPNPIFSSFVKIDGDGMSQTIKFKPNDNFFFAVYLGNGNVFETLLKDNFSPLPPKGFLQISASFAFKRL